jgi:hypothetical protein
VHHSMREFIENSLADSRSPTAFLLLFPKRREAHIAKNGGRDDGADVHGVHPRAERDAQEDVQQEHQEHDGSDDHTADRHGFAHLFSDLLWKREIGTDLVVCWGPGMLRTS